MKKLLAVLLTVLMVLGLAACSNTNNEEPGDDTPSTTYKVGLGISTSVSASSATEDKNGKVQSTDTYALVVLDAEGKIVKVDIDAAQNAASVTATGEVTGEAIPTKTERKEDYNMKGTSPIGKEWYEQTAAFEEYCVGKTLEEVAAALEMPLSDLVYAMDAISDPVSLFDPVYHDGNETVMIMDQVSDLKNCDEKWINNVSISEAIDKLNEREKEILMLRFYEGKTQVEVSEEIGISQAQVSRLEKNAKSALKKSMS